MQKFFARPSWKSKDIIRHVRSGKPYFVLHTYIDICTLLVDLEANSSPSAPVVLLPRDYDNFARDCDMNCKVRGEIMEWEYNPISL